MTNKITVLNNSNQSVIGEIEVEDAYIYEKINDKYTFEFTCYEQSNTNLLAQDALIFVDDDYFRIESVVLSPINGKYQVSCEHVSYELNDLTPEEEEEDAEDLHYEGFVWTIIREILEDTRFDWVASDDIPQQFKFVTKTKGKRSRIIEFCQQNGLEAHWYQFDVKIQTRRGHDYGLEIELGQNLRDLTITKRFNFNGSIDETYDIDFIDLNKILDENGDPLALNEFHMGDTVYLKYKGQTVTQRGLAVGYNPFRRELPTIELGTPSRTILKIISDNEKEIEKVKSSNGGGGDDGEKVIYGVKIDETNSNPESALTYTDGAVGFEPAYMDFGSDTFNYGSWQDKFPFNQIKPCLFEDGEVVGYLNPNNYAEFEDGSPADITSGASGDVMVEFPKIWWKFERIGTDLYVRFASYAVDASFKCLAHTKVESQVDKIYLSAYLGFVYDNKLRSLSGNIPSVSNPIASFRNYAINNNSILMSYTSILMLQVLFVVMFKSLNSQTALGRGHVQGTSNLPVGQTNMKGMFYGKNSGDAQMKFCGIEDVYGSFLYWIDGILTDNSYNILINIGNESFNNNGAGYQNLGKGAINDLVGYPLKVQGGTETAFIVKEIGGSTTTYFCDSAALKADRIAYFGGYRNHQNNAGIFAFRLEESNTMSDAGVSSRIAYV